MTADAQLAALREALGMPDGTFEECCARIAMERQTICDFLDRMSNAPKWRGAADTDEIRHFVGHAIDYIKGGVCSKYYLEPSFTDDDTYPEDECITARRESEARERKLREALEEIRACLGTGECSQNNCDSCLLETRIAINVAREALRDAGGEKEAGATR